MALFVLIPWVLGQTNTTKAPLAYEHCSILTDLVCSLPHGSSTPPPVEELSIPVTRSEAPPTGTISGHWIYLRQVDLSADPDGDIIFLENNVDLQQRCEHMVDNTGHDPNPIDVVQQAQ